MKLKGFGNRAYNIFFHLHTVSGIVIAVALFVIFFAGAFTLFKSEFYLWENPQARKRVAQPMDIAKILQKIEKTHPKFDFDDDTYVTFPTPLNPIINLYGHIKPESGEGEIHYQGKMNPETLEVYEKAESTIGETLYQLHFFQQIPYVGMWLAGFVSLFFIFATVTGVLVHWKNMLTKFWAFSFKGAWKQIWTNSHTVLGLLGLPYQIMYAVTGAFYLLLILVLMPAVMLLYEGKPEKVYALAFPIYSMEYNEKAQTADNLDKFAAIHHKVDSLYGKDYHILAVQMHHIKKEDGAVNYRLVSKDKQMFSSNGYIGYRLKDGSEIYNQLPGVNKKATYKIVEGIMHLHFGSFGGLFVKGVYFVMALFSCFVFVSGILIWKEARNNKQYSDKQKRFHHKVTVIFLTVCFSLFPTIAILFSAELLVPRMENHAFWVNSVFFWSWLALAVVGYFLNSEQKMTRFNLLLGGILSLIIPAVNGFTTGDWFWKTTITQVWATDVFWLVTGLLCLFVWGCMRNSKGENTVFEEEL